ncbi:SDR family oxidoreductase [Nocardia higoensis]|uniref:SDR family oxidoreductase n=1 Tax=Nocardia higoensis TaxID=228599 RepID=A0ABS0D851_9NOCA|nr:SDR family oxidoreductase [Nocardia higoensis]MBF6352948.1 SDR family oxidoreductase [Nocardia higoensis]
MKIFVTGGAGVVGVPLIEMLGARHEVIALTHTRLVPGAEVVHGDITAPGLGLDTEDTARVLDGLDLVVHCAASVDFAAGPDALHAINVTGTQRVLDLAAAAGARLVHVSTAFVELEPPEDITGGHATLLPGQYLAAKRLGESEVRASGLAHTIVRPSAIGGRARTGEITEYQGVHSLSRAMVRGSVPLFLCAASARYDLVPCDVVAAVIAAVAEYPDAPATAWATVGPHSVTADRLLEILDETFDEHGLPRRGPRRADPEVFERLLKPAFFDELGASDKTKMANLMTTLASLFQPEPMPSSLGEIPGAPQAYSATDAEEVIRTTFRTVIAREGMAQAPAAPERNEVMV